MPATKIFLDTEFTGLRQNTTLISLALVAETGEEFYAEFTDYDQEQLKQLLSDEETKPFFASLMSKCWNDLPEKVSKKLNGPYICSDKNKIAAAIKDWLGQFKLVEVWADVLAYDWVLFCDLFGGARHIPENIFFAPFDLATLFRLRSMIEPEGKYKKDISRYDFAGVDIKKQHHALEDARVELLSFKKLMNNE